MIKQQNEEIMNVNKRIYNKQKKEFETTKAERTQVSKI